jgi:lysozyme family protein
MVERFEACLAQVLAQEGGYADHPADPGGATNLGITLRTLADWRGVAWSALGKAEVRALARPEAAAIYRKRYWEPCAGDDLPEGLDLALFDYAVNSGPGRAIRALQGLVGATADGLMGPKTLAAIRTAVAARGVAALIVALCAGRLSFLERLAGWATFGRGWTRRVAAIRAAALAMADPSDAGRTDPAQPRSNPVNFLSGYRTYIVAAAMALAAIAQLLGVELPSFAGQSAGQLLMEAIAVAFLRRSVTRAGD